MKFYCLLFYLLIGNLGYSQTINLTTLLTLHDENVLQAETRLSNLGFKYSKIDEVTGESVYIHQEGEEVYLSTAKHTVRLVCFYRTYLGLFSDLTALNLKPIENRFVEDDVLVYKTTKYLLEMEYNVVFFEILLSKP